MPLTIITSQFSLKHDTGENHPENSNRIVAINNLLKTDTYKDTLILQSDQAEFDQILLAHDENYVFNLQDKTPEHGLTYLDGDTALSPHTYDAALYGAGAACMAVDIICGNNQESDLGKPPRACAHEGYKNTQSVFCLTRPPGHHAEPNMALGFCFFNNVFIAARHAQETHNIKRIAIVDFDVHHGNGTETMSRRHNATNPDSPIFYISTHESPLFPGTGKAEDNNDTLLNIPLKAGTNSEEFRAIYENQVFPALNAFEPELLILSAGFDAHKDDPLASINLETDDFGWLTTKLCAIANKHSKDRVLSVLEGGYNIEALTESVDAHLKALISADKG